MLFKNFLKFKRDYKYNYIGINQLNNQIVNGVILANNEKHAREQLSLQKVNVKQLNRHSRKLKVKIKFKDIFIFSRQISTMLRSGIPLIRSLEIIANGNSNINMKELILDIRNDIMQGLSLYSALSKHSKHFDKLYCGLVQAGEIAGTLDTMFANIANYQEKIVEIKRKVTSALIYPIIIIIVAITAVVLILIFVLPKFQDMYNSLGVELPFITQIVVSFSEFLYFYGIFILLFIIGIYALIRNKFKKSLIFRENIDKMIINLPIFGKIIRYSLISRWGRTLSIVLKSGIPLINSLDLVTNSIANLVYEKSTNNIKSKVNQGESLTNSMNLELDYLFPIMFIQMIIVGEESGTLDSMLEKASVYYENEVNNMVSILSTLIEPVIIVVLGIIIGFIVFAMYSPLWSIGGF